MPEVAQMQTALENKSKTYATQLEAKYKDFEVKYNYLIENQETMMPAVFEAKMNELKQLEENIMKLEEKAQQDVYAYEEQLYIPIEKKAMNMINTVANENGYGHVFDLAAGGILKFPAADDITNLVISRIIENSLKNQPIGIFDSGIGGLTVANAVFKHLPNEQIIYFGDTAHLPYGDKSKDLIKSYALGISAFLLKEKNL